MHKFKNALKRIVKRVLRKKGYRISSIYHFNFLESLLYKVIANNDHFFFIEIGANDGKSFDPIYQFVSANHQRVRGIAIEPVKDYFEELRITYRDYPNVITVNAAIHNSEKEATIYRVNPASMTNLPKSAKGIASFDKDHHQLFCTHVDAIIPETVKCMSLKELLEAYKVTRLDLLQMDTEGYDSEIILNLDFNFIKPKILRFEHGLSDGVMSKETFLNIVDVLHNNGYELWMESYDVTAYQRNILIDL